MKMRYIGVLLLALAMSSCNKDFLEKLPLDSLPPEVFYSNAGSLRPGLFGLYNALREGAVFGNPIEIEGISDNAILNSRAAEFINFSKGTGGTDNQEKLAEYYLSNFQVIQRANALLDNIHAPGDMLEAERGAIEAEARALRAMAYMRLTYLYGRVPLVTTSISRNEALALSQASHDALVSFITSELKAAADVLDTKPYNGQIGRVTKQAALGMRAKVMVYEARMGNGNWNDALAALLEVKTTALAAGIKLLTVGDGLNGADNYAAIFQEANEDHAEILFHVKFDATIGQGQSINNNYGPNQANQTARISVHSNFADDFYGIDGLPIDATGSNYNPAQPYANRDPRLAASIYLPGQDYFFGTFTGSAGNASLETDFAVRKYTYDDLTTVERGLDVIVLRYADVLLMLAEAENEVNGPTVAAYAAFNAVRNRVNMPDVVPSLSKDDFRQEVIHERRVELGFEGQRWFDLVTLGIAAEKINGINELGRKFVPDRQELFPIPKSEIDLNSNLQQNPGY